MKLLARYRFSGTVSALAYVAQKSPKSVIKALNSMANTERERFDVPPVSTAYLNSLGYFQCTTVRSQSVYTLEMLRDETKTAPFGGSGFWRQPIIADIGKCRMVAIDHGVCYGNPARSNQPVKSYWMRPGLPCYGETHWV